MRFIVVKPIDPSGPRAHDRLPAVGVVRWLDPEPTLTVIAKLTLSYYAGKDAPPIAAISTEQKSLTLGRAPKEGLEAIYPSDFVPRKGAADVLLVGNAFSERATKAIHASVSIGPWSRRFVAVSENGARRIPLRERNVRDDSGESEARVGPLRLPARPGAEIDAPPPSRPRYHKEGFDYSAYNAAPPDQQCDWIAPDAPVALRGLSADGDRSFRLPGLKPRILVEARGERMADLELCCDTAWFDTDRELLVLVWRGSVALASTNAREVTRIVAFMEPADKARDLREVRRLVMRSFVGFAAEESRVTSEPADEEEASRLTHARYQLMGGDEAPPPMISLERYARVSAELAEKREPRADTLKRHAMDEDAWNLEERAWVEAMGSAAAKGDGTTAVKYGELFVAAQDELAGPGEARRTLGDYAAIMAAMDEADDPEAVMKDWSITLSEWMRLDRRWSLAMKADPALAREFDRLTEEARSRPRAGSLSGAAGGVAPSDGG